MAGDHKFWDRHAERYSKSRIADEGAYQRKLTEIRERVTPESVLFEFGCGTGSTALALAPYVKRIHATDTSPNMIAIAKKKQADAGIQNVVFEVSDLDSIVAGPDYDAVLAMSILHLVENHGDAIARSAEVLRPGGMFVSSTMCMQDHLAWFRYILPFGRAFGLLPMVRFFTFGELKDSIAAKGLKIEHEWRGGKRKADFVIARKPSGVDSARGFP